MLLPQTLTALAFVRMFLAKEFVDCFILVMATTFRKLSTHIVENRYVLDVFSTSLYNGVGALQKHAWRSFN